eukprot:296521_1
MFPVQVQKPTQSDLLSMGRSLTNTPNTSTLTTPYTPYSPESTTYDSSIYAQESDEKEIIYVDSAKRFENIEIIDVDTSSTEFNSWPPQIENIGLGDIHHKFLNECNTSNKSLINTLKTRTIWMINSTA